MRRIGVRHPRYETRAPRKSRPCSATTSACPYEGRISVMKILVIGGTWFLGKQIAEHALARGWEVTTFNRGRSGTDVPGVSPVHGDRAVEEDLRRLAAQGPWDAVIDTSSSELPPRDVLLSAVALKDVVGRWVHLSTVSVYQGWPHLTLTEDSPLLECP